MEGESAGQSPAVLDWQRRALLTCGQMLSGFLAVVGGVIAARDGFGPLTVLLIVVGLTGAYFFAHVRQRRP
jgi:hypothetical protein